MLSHEELMAWLRAQPFGSPIDIEGESVYLNLHPQGAELGAILFAAYTPAQLDHALRQGFPSALDFDAGLALTPDGNGLVLSQWLDGVQSWEQAARPLENLLNQLGVWRAGFASEMPAPPAIQAIQKSALVHRTEQRLRMLAAVVR